MSDLIELSKALLTPAIAIVTAYIAYQQYKINKGQYDIHREKLRLDLYDKRFKVYQALMKFLGTVLREGTVKVENVAEYGIDVHEGVFLFDSDIRDYLEVIRKQAIALWSTDQRLRSERTSEEERSRAADRNTDLLNWFIAQLAESEKRFSQYLRFADKREEWVSENLPPIHVGNLTSS